MLHHLRHLKTVHHHASRAGAAFLMKAAQHHPILTTALAIVGGASVLHMVAGSKPATTSTVSPTSNGAAA